MFQSISGKLHSGRTRLHISAKNIPTLYPSFSDHFNLSVVGVDPAHSTPQRIIVATDDTQKHITFGMTPLDLWSARCRDLYFATYSMYNRPTSKEDKFTKRFQHGNSRIVETGRYICWIDTCVKGQQMSTDKIRLVVYHIYDHLQVSFVFATIIMLFYKNI